MLIWDGWTSVHMVSSEHNVLSHLRFILQKLQVYKFGPSGGCIFMKSFPLSREIPYWKRYCWWKNSGTRPAEMVNIPLFCRNLYIPGGWARFLPSTVCWRHVVFHSSPGSCGRLTRSVDSFERGLFSDKTVGSSLDRGWRCHIRRWWVHEGYFVSPFKQIEMFWTQLERWYGKHVDK